MTGKMSASPPHRPMRGYIEGYYGRLPDWQDRRRIIDRLASLGMTAICTRRRKTCFTGSTGGRPSRMTGCRSLRHSAAMRRTGRSGSSPASPRVLITRRRMISRTSPICVKRRTVWPRPGPLASP